MLKPVDIQNHTLKTSVSGYNKRETDDFLASVHESYEAVIKENRELKDKITSLSEGIQYYKQMENTLQKALVLAEKTSSETQEAAKIKADEIIKDTQAKADKIIEDARTEADKIIQDAEAETGKIKSKADEFVKESEAKANALIKDAQNKALSIESEAQQRCDDIKSESVELLQNYENYRENIKKFALSQLKMLEDKEFILDVPELEDTDNSVEERFSWNNNEYATAKTPENESGFTFIDTE